MNRLPSRSPFDGGEIIVTRFYCPGSDTSVEGNFAVHIPFAQLTPEQLRFVEVFLRNEGKLSRMEGEIGLSYPTLRSRLHEIIRALGYEPGKDEAPAQDNEWRRAILDDLEAGRLSFDEAMSMLQGGGDA
jgi:hypothetical protein